MKGVGSYKYVLMVNTYGKRDLCLSQPTYSHLAVMFYLLWDEMFTDNFSEIVYFVFFTVLFTDHCPVSLTVFCCFPLFFSFIYYASLKSSVSLRWLHITLLVHLIISDYLIVRSNVFSFSLESDSNPFHSTVLLQDLLEESVQRGGYQGVDHF